MENRSESAARGFTWTGIYPYRHIALIILVDCVIGVAAYVMSFLIRSVVPLPLITTELMPVERLIQVKHYWWLLLVLQPVLLFVLDTYHEIQFKELREFVLSVGTASALLILTVIAVYFFTGNPTFPRTVFPVFWILNTAGIIGWRMLIKRIAPARKRRVLIVGSGPLAQQLVDELGRDSGLGLEVVGIVSDHLEKGESVGPYRVLGNLREIDSLIGLHQVEEVILTPEEASWKDQLVDSIAHLEGLGARISVVPSIYEILIGRIKHFEIRGIPLIEIVADPYDPVAAFCYRLRDVVLAVILSIILLPLWIVVAAAIKLFDGGPIFYVQDRVGQWGKLFRLYKFKTMPERAEDETGPVLAAMNDPRLTPLGRILRSYRIDESLQLLNVIKGDMSLVGPRPERPEFVAKFEKEILGYSERHKMRPGLTGLAQVRGHYHTDPVIKLKYDLAYIYNHSFLLDLVILLETVRIVIRREGV
jgi:exopolysaccharide biosynthesis polyprenyl glycosylphosphotransferase